MLKKYSLFLFCFIFNISSIYSQVITREYRIIPFQKILLTQKDPITTLPLQTTIDIDDDLIQILRGQPYMTLKNTGLYTISFPIYAVIIDTERAPYGKLIIEIKKLPNFVLAKNEFDNVNAERSPIITTNLQFFGKKGDVIFFAGQNQLNLNVRPSTVQYVSIGVITSFLRQLMTIRLEKQCF